MKKQLLAAALLGAALNINAGSVQGDGWSGTTTKFPLDSWTLAPSVMQNSYGLVASVYTIAYGAWIMQSKVTVYDGAKVIKTQGCGDMAMQGLQGLGNSYMGMKQFGLAEDALKEQKRQFDINFQAQRKSINSQLSDRQLARVASNPTAYQSEAEYMKKWGV